MWCVCVYMCMHTHIYNLRVHVITIVSAHMTCLPHSETIVQVKSNQWVQWGGLLIMMRISQSVSHSTHKNGFSVMVISQSLSWGWSLSHEGGLSNHYHEGGLSIIINIMMVASQSCVCFLNYGGNLSVMRMGWLSQSCRWSLNYADLWFLNYDGGL